MKIPPLESYKAHVIIRQGCWGWNGSLHPFGYGIVKSGNDKHGKKISAHRFSWEIHRGKIPDGMSVLHHCDNPICSNPEHLFLGSQSDNMADMVKKNRQARGDKSGPKLHPESLKRGSDHHAHLHPEVMARG